MTIQRGGILIVLALFLTVLPARAVRGAVAAEPSGVATSPANGDNIDFVRHIGGVISQMHVVDTRAYIIGASELTTVDISNPAQPAILSQRFLPSKGGFSFAGSFLYVSSEAAGLRIYDLQSQAGLVEVGAYPPIDPVLGQNLPWRATSVQVQGSYAYLRTLAADNAATLRIINVANPAAPLEVSAFALPAESNHFTVNGSYLYFDVGGASASIHVLNVANPAAPVEVGSYAGYGGQYGRGSLRVAGTRLYLEIINLNQRLLMLDASNPAHLVKLGMYPGESIFDNEPGLIGLQGTTGYFRLKDRFGVQAVNLANPAAPVAGATLDLGPDSFVAGQVQGQYAYLIDQTFDGLSTLHTVSLVNPLAPQLSASLKINPLGKAGLVATSGDALYTVSATLFQRFSLADPLNPTLVSSRKLDFAPFNLAIEDGYAYLAGGWPDKVVVIDLANPALPIVGTAETGLTSPSWSQMLAVEGRRAYLSGLLDTDLAVIDFTTLNAPTVTAVPLGQTHWGIAVADGLVWHAEYVDSASTNGCYLKATDVHNPAAPQEVANLRVESPDQCSSSLSPLIAIDNDVLYLHMQSVLTSSMNTYDISDPTHPSLQGSHQIDFAISVLVENATVYLSAYASLALFDHSRPAELPKVGSIGGLESESDTYRPMAAVRNGIIYWAANGLTILRARTQSARGTVTQPNGQPFAGASIAASSGASLLSDTGGGFRFQDLPRGPLTFTPSKAGYVFWPPQRTADLPSSAPLRFQITAQPLAAALPSGTQRSLSYTDTQGLPTTFAFDTTALSATSSVAITPTPWLAPMFDFAFTGHAFELAFDPAVAVTATIRYSPADLRLASDPAALALWRLTEGGWAAVECGEPAVHDEAARTLTLGLCQPGAYGLFAPGHQVLMPFVPVK